MKVSALTSFNSYTIANNKSSLSSNRRNNTSRLGTIAFKGQWYPSGYYEDDEISIAKKYLNQIGDEWKKAFKKENGKTFGHLYWNKAHGINHILGHITSHGDAEKMALAYRVLGDFGTLGIWEIINAPFSSAEAGIRKLIDNNKLDKKTARIARLMLDIKAEQEEEIRRNNFVQAQKAARKLEYNNRMESLKGDLYKGFIKLVNDEKLGKTVEIPNVIMLEDRIGDMGDTLSEYARKNSNTYHDIVNPNLVENMQKDLYTRLKAGKQNFDTTGIRTLLEVKDMGNLISKNAPFSLTEWMKDIMTCCAEEFKSTLIFKTFDSSKYVSETMEPHRIGLKIINKIKK
jgi:hypothetical protein